MWRILGETFPEELISGERPEGWFCLLDEEGEVQNGGRILEVKGTLCAKIREKITHVAKH